MRRWWLPVVSAVLGGCGGMVNGPTQRVKINTIPPGAALTVDGRQLANPAYVDLAREHSHAVGAKMAGFEPATAEIESRADDGVRIANCVFFLCLPQIWEGGTPSQYRLEPEELEITLTPLGWSPR